MEYRLAEVRACDGRAVHLMTKSPDWFEKFGFEIVKDYGAWQLMTMQLGPLEI